MKKGSTMTKEQRKNVSEGHKGIKPTIYTRKKMSVAREGKPSSMFGKKHTKSAKEKNRQAHKELLIEVTEQK